MLRVRVSVSVRVRRYVGCLIFESGFRGGIRMGGTIDQDGTIGQDGMKQMLAARTKGSWHAIHWLAEIRFSY